MANDYIPRPDARFHVRQNNFVTYVNGHPANLRPAGGAIGGPTSGSRSATRRRLRPLPVGRPRKRKVEKKRGQK